MIGRADIEGSKSHVAMNAWPPQASYPYGNFSNTSQTINQNEDHLDMLSHFLFMIQNPYILQKISVLFVIPIYSTDKVSVEYHPS